jgi:hypothetical protein
MSVLALVAVLLLPRSIGSCTHNNAPAGLVVVVVIKTHNNRIKRRFHMLRAETAGCVIIGRDTRMSGADLAAACSAGELAVGHNAGTRQWDTTLGHDYGTH